MHGPKAWLTPISGDNPAGPELRGDPRFDEIEALCRPSREEQKDALNNVIGSVVRDPDWLKVIEKSEEFTASTKDIRLMVNMTRALFELDGFDGLIAGLATISDACRDLWEVVHPVIRTGVPLADGARRRLSALKAIDAREVGILGAIERREIVSLDRVMGDDGKEIAPALRETGFDLAQAQVSGDAAAAQLPGLANNAERVAARQAQTELIVRVNHACSRMAREQPEEFQKLLSGVEGTLAEIGRLETTVTEGLGAEGPSFQLSGIRECLTAIAATLVRAKAGGDEGPGGETDSAGETVTGSTGQAATHRQPSGHAISGIPTQIASQDDVVEALDAIVAFYKSTQPASPVPYLVGRLRKIVDMSFPELLEEIAPGGLKEFYNVAGLQPNDKKGVQK